MPGFEGVETATRIIRVQLKEDVTVDQLPQQLRLYGSTALVLVPGRPPLCLRWKKTGHARKDCRVPRCGLCRRFGHIATECVRTYATVLNVPEAEDVMSSHLVDEQEAEGVAMTATLTSDALPEMPAQNDETSRT